MSKPSSVICLHVKSSDTTVPFGLHLTTSKRDKAFVVVRTVVKDSVAAAAGLKVQDVILTIEDSPFRADPDLDAAVTVLKTLPSSFLVRVRRRNATPNTNKEAAAREETLRSPLVPLRNLENTRPHVTRDSLTEKFSRPQSTCHGGVQPKREKSFNSSVKILA